jgi:hypothetical protein
MGFELPGVLSQPLASIAENINDAFDAPEGADNEYTQALMEAEVEMGNDSASMDNSEQEFEHAEGELTELESLAGGTREELELELEALEEKQENLGEGESLDPEDQERLSSLKDDGGGEGDDGGKGLIELLEEKEENVVTKKALFIEARNKFRGSSENVLNERNRLLLQGISSNTVEAVRNLQNDQLEIISIREAALMEMLVVGDLSVDIVPLLDLPSHEGQRAVDFNAVDAMALLQVLMSQVLKETSHLQKSADAIASRLKAEKFAISLVATSHRRDAAINRASQHFVTAATTFVQYRSSKISNRKMQDILESPQTQGTIKDRRQEPPDKSKLAAGETADSQASKKDKKLLEDEAEASKEEHSVTLRSKDKPKISEEGEEAVPNEEHAAVISDDAPALTTMPKPEGEAEAEETTVKPRTDSMADRLSQSLKGAPAVAGPAAPVVPQDTRADLKAVTVMAHPPRYTESTARDNPKTLFLFGENLSSSKAFQKELKYPANQNVQASTQAVIRGRGAESDKAGNDTGEEPNVCPVVTCKDPIQANGTGKWTAADIDTAKQAITKNFEDATTMLRTGKFDQVCIPGGMSEGLAGLNTTPELKEVHQHLTQKIADFKAECANLSGKATVSKSAPPTPKKFDDATDDEVTPIMKEVRPKTKEDLSTQQKNKNSNQENI